MKMKSISIYQVDAFAEKLFLGNPAAVCILEEWLPDNIMQSIASENNLSETAFVNINLEPFYIRWFTPESEMGLCGHATLAAARILFDEHMQENSAEIVFQANRGQLRTVKKDNLIYLDFPKDLPTPVAAQEKIIDAIGVRPDKLFKGLDDYLAILDSEESVKNVILNFMKISELDSRGLIISAKGSNTDFVCRCFYPNSKINEDPVTGSAHTLLVPYWAKQLTKNSLTSFQCSKRGGKLSCYLQDDRVFIGGSSVRYMNGIIRLPC
jgi:PhzF family phenazine biosynthesis protein